MDTLLILVRVEEMRFWKEVFVLYHVIFTLHCTGTHVNHSQT